jgi:N-carbamoyl-L-amino-acid hydrolase
VLRVDSHRLRADFDALAAVGRTPGGGVSRPTFSEAHLAARAWLLDRAAAAEFATRVDAAGNHSAVLPALERGAPTLLLGSHLDSVPDGGRFDGALGVVAALEVLRVVRDAGVELDRTLEAIDFTDEEGTLVGLLGSAAVAGTLEPDALERARGGRDALRAGLARAGLAEERLGEARRDPASLAGYLELHVEQGPVLEREGADIGVVKTIVGTRSFRLEFVGVARHAGTTPMRERRDAAIGAAAFVVAARDLVARDYPGCVATVGNVEVEPGAFNVIPRRARLALEFRSPETPRLDELEAELLALARHAAETEGVALEIAPAGRWEPTQLDEGVRAAIGRGAQTLGLRTLDLASGAGHDAQALAAVTRSGMVLVPSRGGVSHAPHEHTDWDDCVNGANVLLTAALDLAAR